MSITIDTTVGGASANSYNTIAQVAAYAETMSPADAAAWLAIDDTADDPDQTKSAYLVRAARLLDTIPFPGSLVTMTQALQWPRFGVDVPLATGDNGYYGAFYPVDQIPACVLRAHAQLAVFLATQSSDVFGVGESGLLSALKVGPIDLTFQPTAMNAATTGRDYLEREIYPLLRAGNCVGSARSVRLTR